MDKLDINTILDRDNIKTSLINKLIKFENNKNDLLTSRGFYVYGSPGTGKTTFVKEILKSLNYDIIVYDSNEVRNKNMIESLSKNNMPHVNVISLFGKKKKNIAIIMDEIDGMNNSDKGGITSLTKLIRPKKTKKQKLESTTMIPIICIGNNHIDKKISDLMKMCNTFELKKPTISQIKTILIKLMPKINNTANIDLLSKYIDGDIKKINFCYDIYLKNPQLLEKSIINNIFQTKINNDYNKDITKKLLLQKVNIKEHNILLNETDRTIVSLLFHENFIDILQKNLSKEERITFYLEYLDLISYADYIDRITFQKQIWIFNEISSLMKTIHINNKYHDKYHDKFDKKSKMKSVTKNNIKDIRFTKILTKYSTEYNNKIFIQKLCQELNMNKDDLFSFFLDLRNKYDDDEIYEKLSEYNITKLNITRIYKYLDIYTLKDN